MIRGGGKESNATETKAKEYRSAHDGRLLALAARQHRKGLGEGGVDAQGRYLVVTPCSHHCPLATHVYNGPGQSQPSLRQQSGIKSIDKHHDQWAVST